MATKKSNLFRVQVFVLTMMMLVSFSGFSQEMNVEVGKEEITLTAEQLETVATDLEKESELSVGKDKKKAFKKVGLYFKKMAKKLKRDDGKKESRKNKKKSKITLRKVLLGAGKGATWLSMNTARPFVNASGFVTGFFQKTSKGQKALAFSQFILNHSKELDPLWRDSATIEEYAYVLTETVTDIVTETIETIIGDIIKEEGMLALLDLDPALINNHPLFQELRGIFGDVTEEDIERFQKDPEALLEDLDYMSILNNSRIQIHEGLLSYSAKIFVPKLVLSAISKSLGSVFLVAGLVADAGMVASTLMCTMNKKVQDKLEEGDAELRNFCAYVVNKSAYMISKSRAKGYVAGKKARRNFIIKTEKLKIKINKIFKKLKKKKRCDESDASVLESASIM